jgi:hypothetical protein
MESKILYRVSIYRDYWCRIMGDKMDEGSGSGKVRVRAKPLLVAGEIIAKVEATLKDVYTAKKSLSSSKREGKDISIYQAKLKKLLAPLKKELEKTNISSVQDYLREQIAALESEIELPNLQQPQFHPVQKHAIAAAAEVVANWERVTPGVSLNDLPSDARVLLQACTMEEWSPLQAVLNVMIRNLEHENQDPKVITARLNFAIALFQAMVPQFCGMNIPTRTHFQQNENVRNLLDCIAIVACNKSEEGYNPIFVFAEAAFKNPLQFLKDAAGFGFAFGALTEMAGSTVVGWGQQVPSALFQLGKYMVTNPLASFTTYHVAEPYIKGLLQQVFGERFGDQYRADPHIIALFDELSEYYLREGVTDIIGFPPADIDSILSRLNQILYNIGYRGVASMQRTGDILSQALRFPGELCKSMMGAGSAIKSWVCSQGMRLLDRYKFIPQGTDEGLFESILACLDHKVLLDNPDIDAFVIAYLKHNQPTTVFSQSVRQHIARDVLQHGPLLPVGQINESLNVAVDPESQTPSSPEYVGLSSRPVPDSGNISAEPDMRSSNGGMLGQLRTDQQAGIFRERDIQFDARTAEAEAEAEAARRLAAGARPGARGGARGGDLGGDLGGGLGGNFGGRSRSRKHSVSKRTRRKGVTKKQNSKKNKRQSRRKVRRASSRKSRK